MNKPVMAAVAAIVVLLLVIAFLLGRKGTVAPAAATSSVAAAQGVSDALLTVKSLRQDMLRYNGKPVHIKALVVDYGGGAVMQSSGQAAMFGEKAVIANINSNMWQNLDISKEPGWIVADHLGDYFPGWDLPADGGGSLMVTPATPTLHYHDWVELTGTYDAGTNTLVLTNAAVVGHYTPATS